MKFLKLIIFTLWACFAVSAAAQTTARLSTSFIARGEQALLEIALLGSPPESQPKMPSIPNVAIQAMNPRPVTQMVPGRKVEHVFQYIVTSYEIGNYTIPAIEILQNNTVTRTEPLEFRVFNPDELVWSEVESAGKIIRYASSFKVLNDQPFLNQTVACEIKLFVPEDLVIEDWGIPHAEKDGVTAWRFQPSNMKSRINLLGMPYISVAYPSTLTPTRDGTVGIGPAKIRLTTRDMVMDPFPRQINPEIYAIVPKLELLVKSLPDGAPDGYDNAVGNFRLSATASTTAVEEGDPITVDLVVSGSGNLDTLSPPKLKEPDGWKIYGSTTDQRGDERRQLSGTVTFHQSIRPLEMKTEIPPFRLVYFDPTSETYKTVETEPIALQMSPSVKQNPLAVGPVPFVGMPLERMTDILEILPTAQLTAPVPTHLPLWTGHMLAALVAVGLIIKAIWMRQRHRWLKNPAQLARLEALSELTKHTPANDVEFLKTSGGFIERWLSNNPDPALSAILAERDAICFLANKTTPALASTRRNEILTILRKAIASVIVITAFSMSPKATADTVSATATEAYQKSEYSEAIKTWFSAGTYAELTGDTLFNIGNACYRADSPGYAALYYRRAILRDSGHEEARQNLRFIERKYGSITVQRPKYQYALAAYPLGFWKGICWAGLWLCVLATLVILATRSGARIRIASVVILLLAPILASVGALGWRYFPDDSNFAPLGKQAVIIVEGAVLHADAARTSAEVIDAPPGSLCEIIRESGRWSYISFATKTRGWIPKESLEKVQPRIPPPVPKFRAPKSDDKTA